MRSKSSYGPALSPPGAPCLLLLFFILLCSSCSTESGDPALYRKYCANCHGSEGEGLRALYPALAESIYLDQKIDRLPCLIVNGSGNNIVMPGFPQLKPAEVAELISYLNNRWAETRKTIPEEQVVAWLQKCR
jgi:mono/diheme cytochrome c family protein